MTAIRAQPIALREIGPLRERYRREAGCQIVRDSILPRGLADPYVIEVDGKAAGYAGVWNDHFPRRIMEWFAVPEYRSIGPKLVEALSEISGARELEVQTNIPGGRELLQETADHLWVENLLFAAGSETALECPAITFRRRRETDQGPDGEWVVEERGQVIGAGGWLTHYNPPYADLYMEVVGSARRRGIGSFLVQALRRACSQAGHTAAARCDPSNTASRRALERGGMKLCGELLVGTLRTARQES